jgi:large subunit ribosomal protein L10
MSEARIAEKQKRVEELKDKMRRSSLLVITDYLGFSVKDITDLRKKLHPQEAEFRVIKNTLAERAAGAAGFPQFKEHLKGSTAILFGYRDAISPLKILLQQIKEAEKGSIRAGVVEGNFLAGSEMIAISKLPSRTVLLSQVVRGLQAPLYGLVNVLQGPIRKLVYALSAIKKGGEESGKS